MLKIYQQKMNQQFNQYMKSLMTLNTNITPHGGIMFNQET